MTRIAPLVLAMMMGFGLSAQVQPAQANDADMSGLRSIEMLTGWRMDNGRHMAAIRIRLNDGWKTYWRAPGSFGIPARFDWTGSKNITAIRLHWPTPHIYKEAGLTTIGYKKELVLPIEFTPGQDSGDIVVKANLEIGVCADVCVPANVQIKAVLPAADRADVPAIRAALDNRPQTSAAAGVHNVTCAVEPSQDGFQLTARFRAANAPTAQAVTVVEYPNADIWIDEATTRNAGRDVTVSTTLFASTDAPILLDRSQLRLTLFDRSTAIDIQGCPAG